MFKCDGTESMKASYWVSGDVPNLNQQYSAMLTMSGEKGAMVKMEMGPTKVACSGFGSDAKPKHELPKE